MWTFFIRTGPIPTRRWKKRWARSPMPSAAARRFTRASRIMNPPKPRARRKFSANSEGIGCIVFSPLAKGLLTDRYFKGIPADSRAGHDKRFLRPADITAEVLAKTKKLNDLAQSRGQSLAQMALAWVLRHKTVTSALIGASRVEQVEQNVAALNHLQFTGDELRRIDELVSLPAS